MKKLNNASVFKLPKSLYFAWLLREDARQGRSIDDTEAQKDFLMWWVLHRQQEYPHVAPLNDAMRAVLFEPLNTYPKQGYFGISRLLSYIYSIRKDIQKLFKLDNKTDIIKLNQWFYLSGLQEHGYLKLIDKKTLKQLNQPINDFINPSKNSSSPLLSPLMFFTWSFDTNLQTLFNLETDLGREQFLGWFFLEGVYNLNISELLTRYWIDYLDETVELDQQIELKRLAYLAWKSRADLQQAFDIKTFDGQQALIEWTKTTLTQSPSCQWLQKRLIQQQQALGVNLIGFAFGELGIGEDLRMAAAACDAVGIPYRVVNISPGKSVRQNDRILAQTIKNTSENIDYSTNIFCLTGFDNVRVYLEQDASLFENHYNIGWWPWELPVWPEQWQTAFDVVDEIWAATTYTQVMYKNATDKPVTLMPLPVSVKRTAYVSRKAMGLPENTFLFLYVFDFNSYLARKNPQAAVKAFINAFPKNNLNVGLVLKTMNSDSNNPQWQAFKSLCQKDKRIIILDETLDREEVLGLINCCDAYLSLHSAEGFGRTPAEAMLFGKPVIATDFSGTVDFISQQTGFPVQWQRKMLKTGDYPFITTESHAYWAEPDIHHAAAQMQHVFKLGHNMTLQNKTQQFALQQFSLSRIGKLIKQRLREIKNNE